jgi:hypothetical protein
MLYPFFSPHYDDITYAVGLECAADYLSPLTRCHVARANAFDSVETQTGQALRLPHSYSF